jgi:hypothetical protein
MHYKGVTKKKFHNEGYTGMGTMGIKRRRIYADFKNINLQQ